MKNKPNALPIYRLFFLGPNFFKDRDNKFGLGWYSEQCFESMHSDMRQEWDRVKVSDKNHPDFKEKLLNFVCAYNAKHI